MNEETILIVEDSEPQRLSLQLDMEARGFSVSVAGTVREAREKIRGLKDNLALMVLDMNLEDKEEPGLTGANLGLEVVGSNPPRLPEFLILSAWSRSEYYNLAIKLGVAAYLFKEETSRELLIYNIRALMIRRNLSLDNPMVIEKIGQIAETSHQLADASIRFCREVLAPALTRYLGAPFMILVKDVRRGTVGVVENDSRGSADSAFEKLETLIHSNLSRKEPIEIKNELFSQLPVGLQRLAGAAFITIPVCRHIRLSIGVLDSGEAAEPTEEKSRPLAEVLLQYLRREVLETLLMTLANQLDNKSRKAAELLSHSFTSVGEDQLDILSKAVNAGELSSDSLTFQRLLVSSEALRDTGQVLTRLGKKEPGATPEQLSMRGLVESVLDEMQSRLPRERRVAIKKGDCMVRGKKADLQIAVSSILQWLGDRRSASDAENMITIEFSEEGRVTFEDHSRRLSRPLRQRLFSPFADDPPSRAAGSDFEGTGLYLPLYVARTLIEVGQEGFLEDCSEEMVGEIGHRFVISFPGNSLAQ